METRPQKGTARGQIWVVLRVNLAPSQGDFNPENHIAGTKAFPDRSRAENEAKRLNALNRATAEHYVVVMARLRDGPDLDEGAFELDVQ